MFPAVKENSDLAVSNGLSLSACALCSCPVYPELLQYHM